MRVPALCLLLLLSAWAVTTATLVGEPAESQSAKTADELGHPLFTKDELGYMVWTVMHVYSAFVPEQPTADEQLEIKTLITLL